MRLFCRLVSHQVLINRSKMVRSFRPRYWVVLFELLENSTKSKIESLRAAVPLLPADVDASGRGHQDAGRLGGHHEERPAFWRRSLRAARAGVRPREERCRHGVRPKGTRHDRQLVLLHSVFDIFSFQLDGHNV